MFNSKTMGKSIRSIVFFLAINKRLQNIIYGRLHKRSGSFGNVTMKIEVITTDRYEVPCGFPMVKRLE